MIQSTTARSLERAKNRSTVNRHLRAWNRAARDRQRPVRLGDRGPHTFGDDYHSCNAENAFPAYVSIYICIYLSMMPYPLQQCQE